jgi:hypothetical protein
MSSRSELSRAVQLRAGDRCEYCCMAQSLQGASFHLEHVIPLSRGGGGELDNLAWACPGCNLHKANRIEAIDPLTGQPTSLFNPPADEWAAHFHWDGLRLRGTSAIGRATVDAFNLNHERRLMIRRVETAFGLSPPSTHAGAASP